MKQLGRYRLDRIHGSGAFATVWQGFDTELDIPVAVKVLAENWSHHADVRERFLDEARLLRRIRDERVVRVHDLGVHEGQPYFVMDFIAGGTLADRADGSLPPARALELAIQAARAVHVLHEAGVIHRDVKPSNLLVDVRDDGLEQVPSWRRWTVGRSTPCWSGRSRSTLSFARGALVNSPTRWSTSPKAAVIGPTDGPRGWSFRPRSLRSLPALLSRC